MNLNQIQNTVGKIPIHRTKQNKRISKMWLQWSLQKSTHKVALAFCDYHLLSIFMIDSRYFCATLLYLMKTINKNNKTHQLKQNFETTRIYTSVYCYMANRVKCGLDC